jgi:hypothetical protein
MIHKTFHVLNKVVEKISPNLYFILIGIWYIIYFVTIIGLAYVDPIYVKTLNTIIQTFIAFVLFIRFNPFQKNMICNQNDRIFVLASCFFLLLNDEFTHYIQSFFQDRIDTLKTFF